MVTKATVRVRTENGGAGERPARAHLERAAELLKQSGFEVLRVGRFGVNIQGHEEAFKQNLGVDVDGGAPLVEPARPQDEELSKLVDEVEVAQLPLNFGDA